MHVEMAIGKLNTKPRTWNEVWPGQILLTLVYVLISSFILKCSSIRNESTMTKYDLAKFY